MNDYDIDLLINTKLSRRSKDIRLDSIKISKANGGYHYGGSFSSSEITTVLRLSFLAALHNKDPN